MAKFRTVTMTVVFEVSIDFYS